MFVVKEVNVAVRDSAMKIKALQQEVELLKELKHPNIVQYLGSEVNESNTVFSLFLEFVSGGSIAKSLLNFGRLDECIVRHYTGEILYGLQYLHANHVIHRDIKTHNVLVTHDGRCKIVDFGCSKHLAGLADVATSLIGTPQYASPEVVRHGGKGYGMATDIWSLGCTVLEMLTGGVPWPQFTTNEATLFNLRRTVKTPDLPGYLSEDARDFLQVSHTAWYGMVSHQHGAWYTAW
jgi:serine/threonine protein kinase